jgi:Uracil phosphoribosyltransferase
VINSGKSLAQYLKHIQSLVIAADHALDHLRVHVIAGVMQSEAALSTSVLAQQRYIAGTAVTYHVLRISDNKYTGKGGTDTGNRLFNTTNLK